jgi:PhoH-like ATPase
MELPRTFIVDTNVLLYDPNALSAFAEHDIVIPMTVIEEMDRFKKDLNETGRNARSVARFLDGLRSRGSLNVGVVLEGGGTLRVDFSISSTQPKVDIPWGPSSNDNRILLTVRRLHKELNGNIAFVTRDTNMRLKCDAMGVVAEDYTNARIEVDDQYTGVTTRVVTREVIDNLYRKSSVRLENHEGLYSQQFVILSAEDAESASVMVRVMDDVGNVRVINHHREGVRGIFARNKEQLFALELLLDDSVNLVTLNGVAGTGKTLLALACGLQMTLDDERYNKLLVSRPIFPMGKDLGFLPGDLETKLNPWMKPIFDNLDFIFSGNKNESRQGKVSQVQRLVENGTLEVEALTYIRGRSIPKQYLIVDEAQNLTPHEVKTVLTRAGEGTKIILTGDPNQIDNPYVDAMSNGLTYTVERFKSTSLAGHVTLRKGERSPLAELATRLL